MIKMWIDSLRHAAGDATAVRARRANGGTRRVCVDIVVVALGRSSTVVGRV